MELKQQFQATYPSAFFLENEVASVEQYLRQQSWLEPKEVVESLEKPGEGNMNLVLRVRTNHRSFILKQARPWVEKFPQIPAPVERVGVEAQFFQTVDPLPNFADYTPSCLGYDRNSFILATEDLGNGVDYSFLYQVDNYLSTAEVIEIAQYLSALHQVAPPANFPENKAMRLLNHEHIFNFPFLLENGFDLNEVQKGLQEIALPYKKNDALKLVIQETGAVYLSKGKHLLHGDFYPGSLLKTGTGLKIIDPEFSFVGPAEFDVGVLLAHLMMAKQPRYILESFLEQYEKSADFSQSLLTRFIGIEILRRLIGIAQLPLPLSIKEKELLLATAEKYVMQ